MQVHFALFVLLVFVFGVAFGFTSKVLWQYKQFIIAGIVGYFAFIMSKKIWIGAIAAIIVYFLAGVIL